MAQEIKAAQYSKSFTKRLKHLIGDLSQREFARRIGVPSQSVSRYLGGTVPPLWVLNKIVKQMGVNPAWLVIGEGAPFIADVNARTLDTAQDMLELVQAMSAVGQMRLGALTGKDHFKALRELNDSLLHYEKIKERVSNSTAQMFRQINKDLRLALREGSIDEAKTLVRAGEQVQSICHVAALVRDFAFLKSWLYHTLGDIEQFTSNQQEAIRLHVIDAEGVEDDTWFRIGDFVAGFFSKWQIHDARQLSESYLGLSRKSVTPAPAVDYLESWLGFIEIDSGRLSLGRTRLEEAYRASLRWSKTASNRSWPKRLDMYQDLIKMQWHLSLYYQGMITFSDVHSLPIASAYKQTALGLIACWSRDAKVLETLLHSLSDNRSSSSDKEELDTLWIRLLLDASRGRRTQVDKHKGKLASTMDSVPPGLSLFLSIALVEAEIFCDKRSSLKKTIEHNDAVIRSQVKLFPPLPVRATHYRQVVEVLKTSTAKSHKRMVQEASDFFQKYKGRGYHFLDSF